MPERVAAILTRLREVEKELERARRAQSLSGAAALAGAPTDVHGVNLVTHFFDPAAGEIPTDDLRALALDVRGRLSDSSPGVVAVAGVAKSRPVVVVATNDEARRRGVKAGELVREAAGVLGGGGGGKDDVAQGGGTDAGRIDEALHRIAVVVGERVSASCPGSRTRRRRGIRLALDVGSVRIGVARSDLHGMIAIPVETITVAGDTGSGDARIAAIVAEYTPLEVLVGLPRSLSGREGPSAATARKYAVRVAGLVSPTPVRLVDERFSTVSAHDLLREAGVDGRRRRPVVDQMAAAVFLQAALDGERSTGQAPGTAVEYGLEDE